MNQLNMILEELRKGNLNIVYDNKNYLNTIAIGFLNTPFTEEFKEDLDIFMRICNIVYNNTDSNVMVIEDGIYDMLQELYKRHYPDSYQVGAEVIHFENSDQIKKKIYEMIQPFEFIDTEKEYIDSMWYSNELIYDHYRMKPEDIKINPFNVEKYITKRMNVNSIEYPELLGTLDKCKFVLTSDAVEAGVVEDPNVTILERDYFQYLIEHGLMDPNRKYLMDLELKYDGVSVSASCDNVVQEAETRGDTGVGVSSDITPILEGYAFPRCPRDLIGEPLRIKFEAIMTYPDLWRFNLVKGKNYKNARTAIIGLFGSSDAYKYRDFITLVPLQIENLEKGKLNDRDVEIEFLNQYFSTGEKLRSVIIEGTYKELLFQIRKFVKEAEYARSFIPFMYDGVVVSFIENDMREKLGRKNFVNKYSMAIKFEPITKQTEFLGYTYEVGQDGRITPMIHYNPVEFYGTIHPKSSGHSYERFKKLGLCKGDILDVKYVNDVMPYVKRAENEFNDRQRELLEPEKFIDKCPACGGKIVLGDKMAFCTNRDCTGRIIARATNMIKTLGIKDFAEERVSDIGKFRFHELMEASLEELSILGEVNSMKIKEQIDSIKTNINLDYRLIGSLGFTNIREKKWKLILERYTLRELFSQPVDLEILRCKLSNIKGIGPSTIDTIVDEYPYYMIDIDYILNKLKFSDTKSMSRKKQIRFTGVRDKDLVNNLEALGYDIGEGSITKQTDIVLIPYEGHTSKKTSKAIEYGAQLVPIDEFRNNLEKYL